MIKFPFFNSQELNLDWIMLKLKEILKFMPLNGNVGDVLQRKPEGAAWEALSAVSMDIHSLASTTPASGDEIPLYDISAQGNRKITVADIQAGLVAPVTSVNTKTGAVVLDKTDIGLGNVANVTQYSASNPPPYPVTSVNGMTGDVVVQGGGGGAVDSVNGQIGVVMLDAADVGALPDNTVIPTKTSDLNNDSGFVTSAQAAAAAPVQSVNGQTGAVTVQTTAIDFVGGTSASFDKSDLVSTPSETPSSNISSFFVHVKISADKRYLLIDAMANYTPNTTAYTTGSFVFDLSQYLTGITISAQWEARYLAKVFVGASLMTDGAEISLRVNPNKKLYIDHYYPSGSGVNRWSFAPTLVQLF